jgi:hypothetical protein
MGMPVPAIMYEAVHTGMTEEGSILQSNRMIIIMTNEIGGLIIFPILDTLMGFLSSIIVNFVRST